MAEKRRRNDMNDAIDRLRALLPQQVTSEKLLTKVEVLLEAADHLTQVQNLCAKLIAENNSLTKHKGNNDTNERDGEAAPPAGTPIQQGDVTGGGEAAGVG